MPPEHSKWPLELAPVLPELLALAINARACPGATGTLEMVARSDPMPPELSKRLEMAARAPSSTLKDSEIALEVAFKVAV